MPPLSLAVPLAMGLKVVAEFGLQALELKERGFAVIVLVVVENFGEVHAGFVRALSDSASDASPSSEVDVEAEAVGNCNYLVRHSLQTKSRSSRNGPEAVRLWERPLGHEPVFPSGTPHSHWVAWSFARCSFPADCCVAIRSMAVALVLWSWD